MDEHTILVIGALLHDIGKFVQRASGSKEPHDVQGERYLEGKTKIHGNLALIPLFARYHHAIELKKFSERGRIRNLLRIVCEADSISASERDEGEVIFGMPLKSIFSSVELKEKPSTLYYTPSEISLDNIKFPENRRELTKHDYEPLFKKFDSELSNMMYTLNPEKLLILLEKYMSFIPSKMSAENDVSLFDHLKTTAAVASCLYYYHKQELDGEPDIENRQGKKYLLVGGDISGIQDFIYNVSYKGALKYLRARSAFLEFLTLDVALEILSRLNLSLANMVYAGGGNFYLLLPNTKEAKDVITAVKREANSWLLKKFEGNIFVAISFIETDGNSMMKMREYDESLWDKINSEIKKEKQRKFQDCFEEEWWLISTENKSCKVCGKRTPDSEIRKLKFDEEEELEVCQFCEELLYLGKELLEAQIFVRTKTDKTFKKFELPFSKIYLCRKTDLADFSKDAIVLIKNSYSPLETPHRQLTFLMSDYAVKDEDGGVKSFDKLADSAAGAKKIALLKMDVDNLGKIFSDGLKDNSLSRSSTLSRMFNLFFKAHLNAIIENYNYNLLKIPKNGRQVVVIYSGGDDLMVGGTWNDILELAFEIRETFKQYVGQNPNITISAGYGIFDRKTPMIRMAKIISDRLEKAKEEGKDRINLMERDVGKYMNFESYKWDDFLTLWRKYSERILNVDEFPRSLIYRLLEARRAYIRDEKSIYWFIFPLYHLSRRKGEEKSIFSNLFILDTERMNKGVPQQIFFIDGPLKFVDLVLRGGDGVGRS